MSDSHCFNINRPTIILIIFNFNLVSLILCAGGGGGSRATARLFVTESSSSFVESR